MRRTVNKRRSAAKFRGQVRKSREINVRAAPARGGFRL